MRKLCPIPAPLGVAAMATLLLMTGCAPRPAKVVFRSPHEARAALAAVNQNLARIRAPIQADQALISFRFHDDQGAPRRFIAQPATLIFAAPRCFYLDIKSPAGSVARIGANQERYWLWVDAGDTRTLWWGSWAALERGRARSMAVRPGQLLDALMLRPLPDLVASGVKPLLLDIDGSQRLLFQLINVDGWPFVQREIELDRARPAEVRQIIDHAPDGRVAMRAALSNYAPIQGADGATPRRYVIEWPLDDAELRLDLSAVRVRTAGKEFCTFPASWRGQTEMLDEDSGGSRPSPRTLSQ